MQNSIKRRKERRERCRSRAVKEEMEGWKEGIERFLLYGKDAWDLKDRRRAS